MMCLRHAVVALCLLLVAMPALAVGPAKAPAYLAVKDWLVACDNVRRCEAHGFSDAHMGIAMTITRAAGPAAWPTLSIKALVPLPLAALTLDGVAFNVPADGVAAGVFDKDTPGSAMLRLDGKPAFDLLDRLRRGKLLSFGGPKGDSDPTISLAGLSAVLLLMDDVQGRLGTQTALIRKGQGAADTVPPAPPLPPAPKPAAVAKPVGAGEAGALIKALRALPAVTANCDTPLDKPMDEVDALTDKLRLVLIECMRGAYQSSSVGFLVEGADAATARPLALALPLEKKPLDLFGDAGFDAKTATLSMSAKGRGPADCGESASWVFDGTGFVLVGYARQDKCGGVEPGDWPALWRSAGAEWSSWHKGYGAE